MQIYVDGNREKYKNGDGSRQYPFHTISEAAEAALPGDEVIVLPGIYREAVSPKNAGREDARITYRSSEKGAAVITGAEVIDSWTPYARDVWMCRIPNEFFGNYNPYTTNVSGDWYIATMPAHTGDVYLHEKSMYEVQDLEKVLNPEVYRPSWDPEFSVYTWYTMQDEEKDETIIYANFHGLDPNAEKVEISVRSNCFHPEKEGIGYITLSGFTVCKAATQWAPPTAFQEGMIGPHWSKGWIIEDCHIYEAKCSGISLGKYRQEKNDNKWLKWKLKDGTQTERECILQAQREGWTKERIGSHIVRRCEIHDCGQTGIVGHLGGVFSLIEDNHIHHINNKQNLAGAEIGGIKMHAAIDVIYRRNHIHHCTRGMWLDWQAQGTRVTQNLFHDNSLPNASNIYPENADALGEDIFVEVSHGPTLIDHNLLLSDVSMKLCAQGIAVVHNLIAGSISAVGRGTDNGADVSSPRYTPYHVPHRTEVEGFMTFLHGDTRYYNNIFVQKTIRDGMEVFEEIFRTSEWRDGNMVAGTFPYEEYPSEEEYLAMFEGYCGMGAYDKTSNYYRKLPVWCGGNDFFNGAKPTSREEGYVNEADPVTLELTEENGCMVLTTNLAEYLPTEGCRMMATKDLGLAFEPEQAFENPDGTPIIFNIDYHGEKTGMRPQAGPFGKMESRIEVWNRS